MENIKDLSPSEIKMIELKRKEEQLELERQKIKKEQLREEQLKKMVDSLNLRKKVIEIHNSNVQLFIDKCREEGIDKNIIWVVKGKENITIKVENTYSYSELTKDDEVSWNVDKFTLNSKWSSWIEINNEGKVSCSNITGRWQAYTPSGFIKKIKEKVEEEKKNKESSKREQEAIKHLTKYFKSISPEGTTIEIEEKYIRSHSRNQPGYNKKLLKITYPNTSWVKVSFWGDNNWSINEKYDHRKPNFDTKEEWLDYLSK